MVIRFKKKTEETAAQDSASIPAPIPASVPPPAVAAPKVEPAKNSISGIFARKKKKLIEASAMMSAGAAIAAASMIGGAAAASMGSIMTIGAASMVSGALAHKFNPKAKIGNESVLPLQVPKPWTQESADDAEAAVNDGLRGSITVKGPLQYKQRGTMWMIA